MSKSRAPDNPDSSDRLSGVHHGFAPDDVRHQAGPDAPPLADIATRLIGDIKATAATEMALLQARAALAGDGARRAAMWGAIAGGTVLIALLAIVFGTILAIAPYTGAVAATVIVGGVLLMIAAIAGFLAHAGTLDIRAAFAERGDDVHWEDEP